MPEDPKFHGVLLPEEPTIDQVREIVPDYTEMLLRVMTALADRADRHPDYPFVDTKLDLITGGDFPEEDPIRGRETIYGWIQGRALEALAGHCIWIHRQGLGTGLLARLQALMRRTLFQLRQMRRSNNGRLSFFMTPEGAPFKLGADGQKEFFKLDPNICGTSDLFCAKGMLAAARVLGDLEATDEARAYCHQVDDAIWQDRYASDQQPLDPKNPVTPVPGRHPHGQFMIQIGTAAMMAAMEANRDSIPLGLRLIRHELRHHANLENRLSELEEFDFWEAIDDEGQPYRDGDTIVCDPGHALEFVGLALKFTSLVKHLGLASDQQLIEIDTIETALPPLLLHIFDLGFLPGPGGIIKAYDLDRYALVESARDDARRHPLLAHFQKPRLPARPERLSQCLCPPLPPPGSPSDGGADPQRMGGSHPGDTRYRRRRSRLPHRPEHHRRARCLETLTFFAAIAPTV